MYKTKQPTTEDMNEIYMYISELEQGEITEEECKAKILSFYIKEE